jgi:hypothetical protein
MPRIRFLCGYRLKTAVPRDFAEGEILECRQDTADHFIRRQVAILLPEEKPPAATAAAAREAENSAAKKTRKRG